MKYLLSIFLCLSFLLTVGCFGASTPSKSKACDCFSELQSMRVESKKYNDCIQIAVDNYEFDPYNWFKDLCGR